MRIRKLELAGYIRLIYAGIKRIVYEPESEYQLVIGTNGSGKSSLIAELSPLPASKQDFLVGGYKYVELEHNGRSYTVKSEFSHGNRHTFIVDGEVLNDAGTAATQKELVLEHFGYDKDLHDLITGETKFTAMSTQQRRDWISRACSSDVTYALGLFNRLKSAARDAIGARKHAETRLAVEYKGLFSDDELNALQVRIDELTTTITELMYSVDQNALPRVDASQRLEEALAELRSIAEDRVLKMDLTTLQGEVSLENLGDKVRSLASELGNIEQFLTARRREFVELEDTLQQLAGTGNNSLQDELGQLNENLKAFYEHRIDFDFGETDFIHLYRVAENIDNALTDKLLALPPNPGKCYNKHSLEEAQRKNDELVGAKNVKSTELARLNARKETILGAEKTTCPSCGYIWVPGVSEQDLRVINEKIELLAAQLQQVNEALQRNGVWLEELLEWRRLFTDFRNLLQLNSVLAPLWKEFIVNDLIYEDPNGCVHLFYRWKDQLKALAERTRLEHRIEEINVVIKRANEISGGGSTAVLTTRAKQLEVELTELSRREVETRNQYEYYSRCVSLAVEWQSLTDKLYGAVNKVNECAKVSLKAQVNDHYRQIIGRHQSELAQLSYQLNEKKSAKEIVASLERQRDELLQKEEDFKLLIAELSPTSGMIADQLSGCIDALVEQMNDYISCVWTYDLIVMSCGLDNADLDYKFPMEVKSRPKLIPDVSKGSGAMKNIVDFTFVLVVMSFLDLKGYPLFPDELGSTFDPEHRMRLVGFFKQLVESRRTSQIFYISHNPEAHDTLISADVLVMDSANVGEVPGSNQNVTFEYAA
ncbi:hypothetical protein pEaSNUABM54_00060 [Erwinia phage pEa_SNUABM_54]|nr:hypothetical protein pEaSNUABM54_00060 [Erwinia phage pEa_SNUABM_54]